MKAFHLNDIGIDALREVELDSRRRHPAKYWCT